jgi:hypothetical protein
MRSTLRHPCPNKARAARPSWCIYCYENLRKRASHQGHRYVSKPKVATFRYSSSPHAELLDMKRESQDKQKRIGKFSPHQDSLISEYPHLNAILTDAWWDDGDPRDLPQLAITFLVGCVQVSIVDIGGRRSTQTTAPSALDAIRLLEGVCAAGAIPWRTWGPKRGK